MSDNNKETVRRFLDALWNNNDFASVDELLASDYHGHSSTVIDGPEGAKQFVSVLRSAFPDYQFIVADQIAEGDRVATRWVMRGTHHAEFQGIPASGRQMTMTGITIFRLAGGKLIDGWTNEDQLGMLQQIGAIPETQHI